MKRTILVLVWGALLVGLWLVLVMDPKPQADARAASPAAVAFGADDRGETGEAQDQAAQEPSPVARVPAAQPLAQAPAQLPPPPTQAQRNDVDPPTPSEAGGKLVHLYDAWEAGDADSKITSAVLDKMEASLRENDISPTDRSIACTASICRTRFTFPDLATLRRLAKIPQDEKIDMITGDPEPTQAGLTIVIYFAPEGQQLPKTPG